MRSPACACATQSRHMDSHGSAPGKDLRRPELHIERRRVQGSRRTEGALGTAFTGRLAPEVHAASSPASNKATNLASTHTAFGGRTRRMEDSNDVRSMVLSRRDVRTGRSAK